MPSWPDGGINHDAPLRLVAAPRPFSVERIDRAVPAGGTLAELIELAGVDPMLRVNTHVWLTSDDPEADAVYVPPENWRRVRPKPGVTITLRVAPADGGGSANPLRIVMAIAVLAASVWLGPVIAGAIPGLGATGFAVVSALGSAFVGIAGNLLMNAIVPPSTPKLSGGVGERDSPTLSIQGARNTASPYGPVPVVLGRHMIVPPYGALPYTELVGSDQYLRLIFCLGYGPLEISDLRIGETPIAEFDDVEIEIRQGFPGDAARALYSNAVAEEPLAVLLTEAGGWQSRTTGLNVDEISVDITFDQGLIFYGDDPQRQPATVQVAVEYSPAGAGAWTAVKTWTVTETRSTALRLGHRWPVARGQYDVRLRRVTPDATNDRVFDRVLWTALRSIRQVDPIALPGMATVALRIRATEQLQGVIDRFNCVVERICPDWDSGSETWVERATSNPASLYRYLLQGPMNKRPLADSRIDLPGLQAWHAANETAGYECNLVVDYNATLKALLDDVAAAGRAAFGLRDGRYTVVRDTPQSVPVQMFSPRNSWDFRGEKIFPDLPHGLKVRFIDQDAGWRMSERIVYDDGYSAANASRFETIDFAGVTSSNLAWKHARFHIAQARLRPEMFSLSTDVEHIVCTRGDLVRVAHDAIAVGLGWGRIKALALDGNGDATAMTLDEIVGMDAGKLYGVRIRRADGTELARSVETVPGQSATLGFTAPVAAAELPAEGDLVLFGEADREVMDCIVHHIEMLDDLAARIFMVDAAPALHDADTGEIPPYDPLITAPPTVPPTPQIVAIDSGNGALTLQKDGTLRSRILASLAPGAGAVRTVAFQGRYRLAGAIDAPWESVPDVPAGAGGEMSFQPVVDLMSYDLQIRAVGPSGAGSPWVTVTDHLVLGKTQAPPPVDTFTVTRLADGTRKYAWSLAHVPADVKAGGGYRIWWYRGATATLGDMALLPPGFLTGFSHESNELSAGSYTFAITVLDSSGNESAPVFLQAELGDPRLRGVLEQLFDHETGWPGTLTDCFVGSDNVLRAVTVGGWDALPATWDALPASWNEVLPNASPIRYETLEIDLGADLNFTPQVTPEVAGTGAITIEMKTGATGDGSVTGAWVPVAAVAGKRYLQIRVSVAGTAPELHALTVLIDGETVVEDYEDIDTSAASAGHVERVATGHFRVETKGEITTITSARVTAFQNAGSGWTWERIKPAGASGVLSAPYAEFKIYQNGTLADAVVDVELKGNK